MYGTCDKCRDEDRHLVCWYNPSTGEELWLCEQCSPEEEEEN